MSDAEGFFLKPWRSDEDDAPDTATAPAGADDPLADFPSRDVSAATEAQIAALPPDPGNVYEKALTCIAQGFAKCDILETLATHSHDDRAAPLVAAEMTRERAELTTLHQRYQQLSDDHVASLERADEIRAKAIDEAMAEEAKRQVMRDEVAALENKLWKERWDASKKASQKSHDDFMDSLTNKYWSSS